MNLRITCRDDFQGHGIKVRKYDWEIPCAVRTYEKSYLNSEANGSGPTTWAVVVHQLFLNLNLVLIYDTAYVVNDSVWGQGRYLK